MRNTRFGKWIGNLLLMGGLAAVGAWGLSVGVKATYQDWGNWVFDRESHGQQAKPTEYLAEKEQQAIGFLGRLGIPVPAESVSNRAVANKAGNKPVGNSAPSQVGAPPAPNNGLLGRLEIPRLGLSAIVREGTGEKTLSLAVGHIRGTSLPGQPGNVAVAGHRDTFFRGLRNIKENDLIVFETLSGRYAYRVESTQIVTPNRVSVLDAADYPQLTLVTCYPFYYIGSAPERFIVKARQMTAQSSPEIMKTSAPVQKTDKPADPKPADAAARITSQRVAFNIPLHHSRQLTNGISIGLTAIDPYDQRMDGWMWVMPDRRTIWLRSQSARDPVVFYGHDDGRRRELVITRITGDSVSGYLLLSPKDSPERIEAANGY